MTTQKASIKNSWEFLPYEVTIHFVVDIKDIENEKLRDKFKKETGMDCAGACHREENEIAIFINLDNCDTFIALVDVVAHEVYHAIGFLYRYISDKSKIADVDEIPAYYHGYLVGEIISTLGYE